MLFSSWCFSWTRKLQFWSAFKIEIKWSEMTSHWNGNRMLNDYKEHVARKRDKGEAEEWVPAVRPHFFFFFVVFFCLQQSASLLIFLGKVIGFYQDRPLVYFPNCRMMHHVMFLFPELPLPPSHAGMCQQATRQECDETLHGARPGLQSASHVRLDRRHWTRHESQDENSWRRTEISRRYHLTSHSVPNFLSSSLMQENKMWSHF